MPRKEFEKMLEDFNKEKKYYESSIKFNGIICVLAFLISVFSAYYVKICNGSHKKCSFEYIVDILYHSGLAIFIITLLYLFFTFAIYKLKWLVKIYKHYILYNFIVYILIVILILPSEFTSNNKNNSFVISNSKHYVKVTSDLINYTYGNKINTNLNSHKDNINEYRKNIKDTFWDCVGVSIIFLLNILFFLFFFRSRLESGSKSKVINYL